jgi:S-adenosylmethionine hydrolase
MRILFLLLSLSLVSPVSAAAAKVVIAKSPLVLLTDFGTKDGAVSAMKGVAFQVSPELNVSDLTHEIPPYNIWEGSYRLSQTYRFWPKGSVFVMVVDPGVGSERKSIVALSKTGHFFVGPDNGLLTLIDDDGGLESIRIIDETKQRRAGSAESNTFHGRDIYAYVGARLASHAMSYEEVGPLLKTPITKITYQKAEVFEDKITGLIATLDPNYGNVWTNIPKRLITETFPGLDDLHIQIFDGKKKVFDAKLPLARTFNDVPKGKPLLYFNSLMNLALALNMGDFAARNKIGSGPGWKAVIDK